MRRTAACALFLAVALPAAAGPPKVPPPVKAAVGEDVQVEVAVEAGREGAYAPGFDTADCLFFRGYAEDKEKMVFLVRPKKPGKYHVVFWTVGEGKHERLVIDATGGKPKPDDDKKPDGDDAKPKPDAADPIGLGGFAVLVTFDPADTTRPAAQQSVLYGRAVREYLDSRCAADPAAANGKAYRIYPDNTDVSRAPKAFADAFAKRGGKDWVLIGTGRTGYSGPLPKTEAEMLALLKRFAEGGN